MTDDLIARAEAALEDTYSALYDSPLVRELADEVRKLQTIVHRQERTIEGYEASTVRADELTAELDHWKKLWRGTMDDADQLRAAVDRVRSMAGYWQRYADMSRGDARKADLGNVARATLAALDGPGDDRGGWSDEIEDAVFTAFGDGVEWASQSGDPE